MTYEYFCEKCNISWEVNKTLKEYESNKTENCKNCGSSCFQRIYAHGIKFIGEWESNSHRNNNGENL